MPSARVPDAPDPADQPDRPASGVDASFQATVDAAGRGDEQAFAELWRRFNPALIRFLTSLAGPGDAEDLASTTWIEVVRSLPTFEGGEAGFRSWVFTIARHRMLDLRRAQGRRPRADVEVPESWLGDLPDPGEVVDVASGTEAALALIGGLPPDQAEVVLLRAVVGLDVSEVAAIVGKSPGAVRVLAHRGLRSLARELEGTRNGLTTWTEV